MYLLGSSLAAALLDGLFEHPAEYSLVIPEKPTVDFQKALSSFSASF
jgi:hypothetical protein